jgi:hypothetical protein
MKISKNTWHFKVFEFWFKQKHGGYDLDTYTQSYYKETFSLCPYVRAILLWAPPRWLFSRPRVWYTLGILALALLSVFYHFHGVKGLEILGGVLAAAAGVIGLIVGVIYLWCKAEEQWKRHQPPVIKEFTTVLHERVQAAHEGVCPLIEFVEEETFDV